eukprot:g62324.t1
MLTSDQKNLDVINAELVPHSACFMGVRGRRHKKNDSVRFIVEASASTISDTSDNIAAASISDNIERSTISTSASGDEREHDDQELQQQEDCFHDHDIDTSDGEVEDTRMKDDDAWIASLDLDQT